MSRFYVPKENVNLNKNEIVIDGEEAHHLLGVMRLKGDDSVIVFDGTGFEYAGFIKKVSPNQKVVTVEIVKTEKPTPEKLQKITLVQAIPKKAKMEYIIEKATELGVFKIIPVVTARTIVRPDEDGRKSKALRWRKIASEASKQCGRVEVPEVDDIVRVEHLDDYDLILFACVSGGTIPIKKALSGFKSGRIAVLIGPEGGFTPEETGMLKEKGNCKFVSLGMRVLKSDTAGIFVLSSLNYEFSV